MNNADVLLAGEYFCDLVFAGLDGAPRLGAEHMAEGLAIMPGGTYNMALALVRLELRTIWANSFGTDLFSRYVRDMAAADGIPTTGFDMRDEPVQRVSVAYSAQGDRGFISYSSPAVEPPTDNIFSLASVNWLLQTFRFEPGWLDFVRKAKARGMTIVLDCRGGDFTLETEGVTTLIGLADYFSPNAEEALRLTGAPDLGSAARALQAITPNVIVKAGEQGAVVAAPGENWTHSAPRVAVVDTVGAGDAFNAGLLLGLVRGEGLKRAVELAVQCGSISVQAVGGRASPSLAALKTFLE